MLLAEKSNICVGCRFSNSEKQCTGDLSLNYSNAYANSLPTLMNVTSNTKLYSTEEILDICPVLSTVEILYWINILLNCWCVCVDARTSVSDALLGLAFLHQNRFCLSWVFGSTPLPTLSRPSPTSLCCWLSARGRRRGGGSPTPRSGACERDAAFDSYTGDDAGTFRTWLPLV